MTNIDFSSRDFQISKLGVQQIAPEIHSQIPIKGREAGEDRMLQLFYEEIAVAL